MRNKHRVWAAQSDGRLENRKTKIESSVGSAPQVGLYTKSKGPRDVVVCESKRMSLDDGFRKRQQLSRGKGKELWKEYCGEESLQQQQPLSRSVGENREKERERKRKMCST